MGRVVEPHLEADLGERQVGLLQEARRVPDPLRDLIVRIGGYSERFVNLTPALQESVIARTEHG